ncbi:UNVERIFIED_CONTAM: hypothetical protein FKN15_029952 [Acipenser sinensis]
MDVSVSVSFIQDELASTIEHAVKAAVDTVLCEITKVVDSKFTKFQMEMFGKQKENEILKLRLEISESELKAVRECMNAAGADIKQPLIFQDPTESHAIPESEAQEGPQIGADYTQEESFDQEWCASLMQVTELTCVKDEEVLQQERVSIKEEFVEQECVPIAEEVPTENNIYTFEENNKLGSNLCDDRPSECELGFRASIVDEGEHDSTPSPQCKNSSNGKPQHKKHRETTHGWVQVRLVPKAAPQGRTSNLSHSTPHPIGIALPLLVPNAQKEGDSFSAQTGFRLALRICCYRGLQLVCRFLSSFRIINHTPQVRVDEGQGFQQRKLGIVLVIVHPLPPSLLSARLCRVEIGMGGLRTHRHKTSDDRFARQDCYGPPPASPLASPCPGIVHHLSGPITRAHAPPPRRSGARWAGGAPTVLSKRDPTTARREHQGTSLSLRHGVSEEPIDSRVC